MEIRPSPSPRLADVAARALPRADRIAEPAQPVRSGQNFYRSQPRREIPTPCSSSQAGIILPFVVRHLVLDLLGGDFSPAGEAPQHPVWRFQQSPIRASKLRATSPDWDALCPGRSHAAG